MVKIYKIDWLSKDAKEAEVYLSDGDFSIVCFSHPLNQIVGDVVRLPIYALNARYILKGDEMFLIEKVLSVFGYKISGRVVNIDNNLIKVGEFIIELDVSLPNDIQIDDFVLFTCDRIDIY